MGMKNLAKVLAIVMATSQIVACAALIDRERVEVQREEQQKETIRRAGRFLRQASDPDVLCDPKQHSEAQIGDLEFGADVSERRFTFDGSSKLKCVGRTVPLGPPQSELNPSRPTPTTPTAPADDEVIWLGV